MWRYFTVTKQAPSHQVAGGSILNKILRPWQANLIDTVVAFFILNAVVLSSFLCMISKNAFVKASTVFYSRSYGAP